MKPEILAWARESSGYLLDQVASSPGLSKVKEWESGNLKPTINQLRLLAKKYHRPLAAFYLTNRPDDFKAISDFRRTSENGISPDLHLQIRTAQERRTIALEMQEEVGGQPPQLDISASLRDDPEDIATKVRTSLQMTEAKQYTWQQGEAVLRAWRDAIESVGVLVFQMSGIDPKEVSGFAISELLLPVVVVNRADTHSRRTFSLLHEFAHLLISTSGVSEFDIEGERPHQYKGFEVWCNAVAAAPLMPQNMFKGDSIVQSHKPGNKDWSEDEISSLSNRFGVSRVAITRRLLALNLASRQFSLDKEREYADEYDRYLEQKRIKRKGLGSGNMAQEAISLLGRPYIEWVLSSYHNDRITLRDVSEYLNLKTKHIPSLEKELLKVG